jgi:rubrerythrin
MHERNEQQLIRILRLAYSGELAAAYAYRGHWHSVRDADEKIRIHKIEDDEWHHRQLVGKMLRKLHAQPIRSREIRATIVGRALGLFCHVSGWLVPMYGAGKLESRNIREYETAARYARDSGHTDFVESLLMMAEAEWDHEVYFRARVAGNRWGLRLGLWPQPPPRENIRHAFEMDSEAGA